MKNNNLREVNVWDPMIRIFHWINFITVFLLILIGLIMMNKGALGIEGVDAKVGLKTLHVVVGYVFVINLLVRFIWAFIGSSNAR